MMAEKRLIIYENVNNLNLKFIPPDREPAIVGDAYNPPGQFGVIKY